MNKAIKSLIISSALGSMAFAGFSCSAIASTVRAQDKAAIVQPLQTPAKHKHHRKHHMRVLKIIQVEKKQSPWHLGLKRHYHFDETQANTITTAALLMSGHQRLKVTKISPMPGKKTNKAFLIQVSNKKGNVIKDLIFNRNNGHIRPL